MLHFQVVGLWRPYPPRGLAFRYSETRKELSWNLMRDVPDTKRCPAVQALHSDSFLPLKKKYVEFCPSVFGEMFSPLLPRLPRLWVIFNMAAAECCSFQVISPHTCQFCFERLGREPPRGLQMEVSLSECSVSNDLNARVSSVSWVCAGVGVKRWTKL